MDKNQFEELVTLLSARLIASFKTEFEELNRKLDSVQRSVDIQTENSDMDHKDFAEMKTNQATIDQRTKEILESVHTMSKRVSDKVIDQTNATIDKAADRVAESVEPALKTAVNKLKNGTPLAQKPWWQFWNRR